MLNYFAATDLGSGIFNYLFTQGVLGVVCVGLIIVVVYQRSLDKRILIGSRDTIKTEITLPK